MEGYMKMLGWKDYRGRWDSREIQVDIAVAVLITVTLTIIVWVGV